MLNEACSAGCVFGRKLFAQGLGLDAGGELRVGFNGAKEPVDGTLHRFYEFCGEQAQKDQKAGHDIAAGLAISVVKNVPSSYSSADAGELGDTIIVRRHLPQRMLRVFIKQEQRLYMCQSSDRILQVGRYVCWVFIGDGDRRRLENDIGRCCQHCLL